jgi:hypothetical protein
MKQLCILLALATGLCLAQPTDTLRWVSYYNGADGWFSFQGPQRAMTINPTDFGMTCPLQIESLKIWFYWGMGSLTDTVYTFRIYAGNGSTLLWESESLAVTGGQYWKTYGLNTPVRIDSGGFYIATTHRSVNPYAHPYVNVDTNPVPTHSLYGRPGAWQPDNVGEFCFFAFVRELPPVGTGEAGWSGQTPAPPRSTTVARTRRMAGILRDASGRVVMRFVSGTLPTARLAPGIYFSSEIQSGLPAKLIVVR